MQPGPGYQLVIEPIVDRYASSDPRRRRDTHELRDLLAREAVLEPADADPGSKGAADTATSIVVAIASAQTLRYVVQALRIWLGRDSTRNVRIKAPGVDIQVDGMSAEEIVQVLDATQGMLDRGRDELDGADDSGRFEPRA